MQSNIYSFAPAYIIVCLDILWKEYHGHSLTISISELDGNSEFIQCNENSGYDRPRDMLDMDMDREGFPKKDVLLNFVQMRGGGRALPKFFVTFS